MQQYQYDAMYKVKYHDFIKQFSGYVSEYLSNDFISKIDHQEIKHSTGGHSYLHGFHKQYGNQFRRYTLDQNGKWFEVTKSWYVGLGNEVTEDTVKAFIIDIYHEYYMNKED
ncbi:hypothetical protein CJ195_21900 [Bacillus sp. UMB0899]|uniref:hypothetical protein n=1 Tax=Metabacillus sp. YM-086 TaxID=3341729 RepID=UPI000C7FEF18|nr:hypothetical protein CJ195_21900 [Bacillus sp. UMB0899]